MQKKEKGAPYYFWKVNCILLYYFCCMKMYYLVLSCTPSSHDTTKETRWWKTKWQPQGFKTSKNQERGMPFTFRNPWKLNTTDKRVPVARTLQFKFFLPRRHFCFKSQEAPVLCQCQSSSVHFNDRKQRTPPCCGSF